MVLPKAMDTDPVERQDATIIGGSFAGLSAAMYIARARRRVCIIDTGLPRNRFAAHSHGFFAQDGSEPGAMLATARSQVAAYPTATFIEGEAIGATKEPNGFSVKLAAGEVIESAKLILAFGISDELPTIPGLAERWGHSILYCPYCHGYEFSGQRLGVLNISPMSLLQAMVIPQWGPTTFYLNGDNGLDNASLAELKQRGVAIEPAPVRSLHGEGTRLSSIELADGRMSPVDALYLSTPTRLNSDIAQQLGCEMEEGPFGSVIKTDAAKMTTVSGVYAAGDIARPSHNITWACADGATAAIDLHHALVL